MQLEQLDAHMLKKKKRKNWDRTFTFHKNSLKMEHIDLNIKCKNSIISWKTGEKNLGDLDFSGPVKNTHQTQDPWVERIELINNISNTHTHTKINDEDERLASRKKKEI